MIAITALNMDLIPSVSFFQTLAAIPLVITIGPIILAALESYSTNPIAKAFLNTTLVVLKTTEVVWRPVMKFTMTLLKEIVKSLVIILPTVKSAVVTLVNTTITAVRTAQSMGMSFANAFPAVIQALKDIGESILIVTKGLGHMTYYILRGLSLIVGSVESVFSFGKRALFEAHLLTLEDLSNVMLPFAIVVGMVGMLYLLRKSPSSPESCSHVKFEPRRSSRIARKRSMLCSADLSDALPTSKKSSAISSNL